MGLGAIEGRPVDDGRDLVFDDLGGRLAFGLAVKFVEATHARIGVAGQNFVDGAGPEEGTFACSIPSLIQPHGDALGAYRAAHAVTHHGQLKNKTDDFCLDWFDLQSLLLLITDHLCVYGCVAEGDDAAIGETSARILLHGPGCRARGLLALKFIHDADEFAEEVASIVIGQGFGVRNQFDAMLAERLNGQFLFDLITKHPRE